VRCILPGLEDMSPVPEVELIALAIKNIQCRSESGKLRVCKIHGPEEMPLICCVRCPHVKMNGGTCLSSCSGWSRDKDGNYVPCEDYAGLGAHEQEG